MEDEQWQQQLGQGRKANHGRERNTTRKPSIKEKVPVKNTIF